MRSSVSLLIAVIALAGCSVHKPLMPIHGPVQVIVHDEDCKPLDYPYPPDGRKCNNAIIIPATVNAR